MPKKVVFPPSCASEGSRASYSYALDELLRIEHNAIQDKRRSGEITQEELDSYLTNVFEPTSRAIHLEINKAKAEAKTRPFWKPDLTTDIVDGV